MYSPSYLGFSCFLFTTLTNAAALLPRDLPRPSVLRVSTFMALAQSRQYLLDVRAPQMRF